jgi:hypothetical protein
MPRGDGTGPPGGTGRGMGRGMGRGAEPALDPEGWVERGPVQPREENACARNAGRPFLTRPEHPVFR